MNSSEVVMADALARIALSAYRQAGRLLTPALAVMLDMRTRAGKEDPHRRGERLGSAPLARPDGPLVWVHAASVGETLSVLALVDRLIAAGNTVLLTTGTVTSAGIAAGRLPAGALHQYVPLDVLPYVKRFLDHWRPRLAVFVESEIWPTTVGELARRAVPQVLVNARISGRSAGRWARVGGVARTLFGRLTLALAQSPADGERLAALGVPRVVVTGNLKFDGRPLAADEAELARLRAAIGDRPSWLAASTHPGEEVAAAEVHLALRARVLGLLTVSAPRHPARGDELRAHFASLGLSVASRSRGEVPNAATDVYLTDTIGEMGLIYRLAPIAFIGGSLIERGGQNPIEPARLGRVVLHGPSTYNFADTYRELDAEGGARAVADADELADAVAELLGDAELRARMNERAGQMVERCTGAVDRTMVALAPLLDGDRAKDLPK